MNLLPLLAATEFIENGSMWIATGHMARGLDAAPAGFASVLAAFTTGSLLMVAMQQHLARRLGYRRYLLWALGLFQLGALASLWAGSVHLLAGARLVQGLGAGALFTSGRVLVVCLFAPAERAAALRRFISLLFGLSALGPLMAAWLLDTLGWQAVFVVPLPLAVLCTWMVWAWLPEGLGADPRPAGGHGHAATWLLVLGAGALQLALTEARFPRQFAISQLAGLLAVAALSLAGWAWQQRGHRAPLLRWQGLRRPGYLVALVLYGLYYLVTNAHGVVVPIYAEEVLGWPTWQVGVLASAGATVSWLTARAYLRWGARSARKLPLMALAATAMALVCAGLATPLAGSLGLGVAVLVKGVFVALFVLPLAGLAFRELGDEAFGAGYQAKNLLRHLMISAGMVAGSAGLAGHSPMPDSIALAGGCATLFAALALASSVLAMLVLLQRPLRA